MNSKMKVTRHIQPREKAMLGMASIGVAISLYNWAQLESSVSGLDNAVALFGFGMASIVFAYYGLKPTAEYKFAVLEAQHGHKLWFKALACTLFFVIRLVAAAIAMLAGMIGHRGSSYELPDSPYSNGCSSSPEAIQSIQEGKDPSPGFYKA